MKKISQTVNKTVTKEMPDDDYLRFKCDTYNATKEYANGRSCQKCNNRGDFAHIKDGKIYHTYCTCGIRN